MLGSPTAWLLNPFSHPTGSWVLSLLAEETGSERMEIQPGFRAQKQQLGFKAMLLVTRALVRAPALCQECGSFLLGL